MTPRERVLTILGGGQPDQVPWFGDLDYWANSLIKRGLKPDSFISSDDYIQWHRELGVGFYLQGYFPFKQIYNNCTVKEWNEGHRRYKEIITPLGSVRECWEYIPKALLCILWRSKQESWRLPCVLLTSLRNFRICWIP